MRLSSAARKIIGFFVIAAGLLFVLFGFIRGVYQAPIMGVLIMLLGIYLRRSR